MITITNTQVFGWEAAIRGMRNPMNSWEKSDSDWNYDCFEYDFAEYRTKDEYEIGPNDKNLMMRLVMAGDEHAKFMRMIHVQMDILAPLYWWKQADTYKVGFVTNSCSTMHKIQAKEFEIDDFSHEHLNVPSINHLKGIINRLNRFRNIYLHGGLTYDENDTYTEFKPKDKYIWWQMIQLLPDSYNQLRTCDTNYATLRKMYHQRKGHKLDEWNDFRSWVEELPYSGLIIGESSEKNDTNVETQEEHSLPSMDEINKLFNEVMKVDGRVRSYRVFDKLGMKILDFYDSNHKSLYAFDLYRVTLKDALICIKEEFVKLTRQNLGLGA